jgi:hypothetical protein
MFSNPDVIQTVIGSNSRSIPVCSGFAIAATTTEAGFISLSGPLQSRFTYVTAVPYSMEFPRGLGSIPNACDMRTIASRIVGGNN